MIANDTDCYVRALRVAHVYRYPKPPSEKVPRIDGHPNFFHVTASPDGACLQLEAGINAPRKIAGIDGARRTPVVALRSSPWKAGGEETPWHDHYDLDRGYVRYYGDHRADITALLGETRGNKRLLEASKLHLSPRASRRLLAPPIIVFRTVSRNGAVKGWVQFCGLAVIERVEAIEQRDPKTGKTFPNYAFDLALLDLTPEGDILDWRWIDDRRNPEVSLIDTLRHAPSVWRDWVDIGVSAIPEIRQQGFARRSEGTAP